MCCIRVHCDALAHHPLQVGITERPLAPFVETLARIMGCSTMAKVVPAVVVTVILQS